MQEEEPEEGYEGLEDTEELSERSRHLGQDLPRGYWDSMYGYHVKRKLKQLYKTRVSIGVI